MLSLNSFLEIIFLNDNFSIYIRLLIISLLIICSALISGSEIAFFSLSNKQIDDSSKSKDRILILVSQLRNKPKRLLAALLVANNFINISIVLLFASISNSIIPSTLPFWLIFTIEIVFITSIILLFGEILPKVYAHRNPIEFSKFMSVPVNILDKYIFFFLTIPMSYFTEIIHKRFNVKNSTLSVKKLSDALELTDKNDTSKEEQKILKGIINFGNTDVKQIMKPRIDVFSVSKKLSFEQLLTKIKEKSYSRIPVYEKKIDNVIGVLYVKDIFVHMEKLEFNWNSLIKEPFFVPENKKLDDLLSEFKRMKIHLAVVVDEYGGNSGIVTLEDVIEEIVGDINDEFDQIDDMFEKIDNKNYVFDGKINLMDFIRILKIKNEDKYDDVKGDSETLAGFLLEQIGFFPKSNFVYVFDNIEFVIKSVDKKRIKLIKVKLIK